MAWHGTGYKITCVCQWVSQCVCRRSYTAANFVRFSLNFEQWFGAWKVRSSLFGVKIRWPLSPFCPNFFTPVMYFWLSISKRLPYKVQPRLSSNSWAGGGGRARLCSFRIWESFESGKIVGECDEGILRGKWKGSNTMDSKEARKL